MKDTVVKIVAVIGGFFILSIFAVGAVYYMQNQSLSNSSDASGFSNPVLERLLGNKNKTITNQPKTYPDETPTINNDSLKSAFTDAGASDAYDEYEESLEEIDTLTGEIDGAIADIDQLDF